MAVLYATGRARVADEAYFFLRFTVAVHAGLGAAELLRVVVARWPSPLSLRRAAAAFLLAWAPLAYPAWADPRGDQHFVAALDPLPADVEALGAWLRANTEGT